MLVEYFKAGGGSGQLEKEEEMAGGISRSREDKNKKRYTQEKEERGSGRACVGLQILGGFG